MKPSIPWTSPIRWAPFVALVICLFCLVSSLAEIGKPFQGFRAGTAPIIGQLEMPGWTGYQAGLRYPDVILSMNGTAVTTGRAITAQARTLPLGTDVTYGVNRNGKAMAVHAATERLGLADYMLSFGIFFLTSLVLIVVGAVAAWMRPDNRAATSNMWLSVWMALYLTFQIDHDLTHHFHPAVYNLSFMFFPCAALAMVLHFPRTPDWITKRPWLNLVPSALGALLAAVVIAGYLYHGTNDVSDLDGDTLATAYSSLVLLVGLIGWIYRLRRERGGRERAQIKTLLLGITFAYVPTILIDTIPTAIYGNPPWPAVSNLTYTFWVFFPLSVAYAIVKLQLFDISLIIKRTTQYALLTAFLVGGYFSVAAGIRVIASWILGGAQTGAWENVLATGMIAVAFMPVRQAISARLDRIFSRTKYDFREVVAAVTAKAQSTLDLPDLTRQFMALVDSALHPRYLYVLTLRPEGDVLEASGDWACLGEGPVPSLKVFIDDPLLQSTGRGVEVLYRPNTGQTGQLSALAALGPHLRVPLKVGEEVVGLVVLGPKRSDEDYSADDRQLLAATRLPLATAIKTAQMVDDKLFKDRVEQELKRAREVQEAMLPRALPNLPGFDFAASMEACFEASGDYYDFIELADGRLAVAVADVAGKGIAAALATAMAKSALYNQLQTDPGVVAVLSALNRMLHAVSKNSSAKSFTTCLYALLDPTEQRLVYATAGHFPPMHFDAASGTISEFPLKGGFPLGVRDKAKYSETEVAVRPGDVFVFYTDGVTEAQAPDKPDPASGIEPAEPFEMDRLKDVIMAHHQGSAAEIHQAIKQAIVDHVAGGAPTDDVTIVVIKAA